MRKDIVPVCRTIIRCGSKFCATWSECPITGYVAEFDETCLDCCEDERFDLFGLEFWAVGWSVHYQLEMLSFRGAWRRDTWELELCNYGMEFDNIEVGDESLYKSAIKSRCVFEKSCVLINQFSVLHGS